MACVRFEVFTVVKVRFWSYGLRLDAIW